MPSPAPGICLPAGKVVSHTTFEVIEKYNVLDDIIKPLSNQPIFEGPSGVKWFDIKEKENEHREYRIYFIKKILYIRSIQNLNKLVARKSMRDYFQ